MIIHIVKNNESLQNIMDLYHVSYEEIISYNAHITDFRNLICGMKVKVPLLSEEVEQILNYSEGFITPYYEKIKDLNIPVTEVPVEMDSPLEKRLEDEDIVLNDAVIPLPMVEKKENVPIKKINEIFLPKNEQRIRRPYPGILPPRSGYNGHEIPK